MNDWNFLERFTFLELLLLSAIIISGFIIVLSLIRYFKQGETLELALRHFSGFIIGILDQTIMVIFNFQSSFSIIIVYFDYTAYCSWFLLIPNFYKGKKPTLLFLIWVSFSTAVNTLFEHVSLIILMGTLPYPKSPIVWTSIHTIIFYFAMHFLGTSLVLYGFRKKNYRQNRKG
ncbi:MAG: hypothetical protein ACTSQP_07780 [Promethearchaeota archaeon]